MQPANIRLTPPSFFKPSFRPATETDLAIIASRLRPEIAAESRAVTGFDPLHSLMADLRITRVMEGKNGLPYASVTLNRAGSDCAVWLAVCHGVERHVPGFALAFGDFCMKLHSDFEAIHALVDARNVSTATLLLRSGFTFVERFEEFGSERRPFSLYTSKRRPSVPV